MIKKIFFLLRGCFLKINYFCLEVVFIIILFSKGEYNFVLPFLLIMLCFAVQILKNSLYSYQNLPLTKYKESQILCMLLNTFIALALIDCKWTFISSMLVLRSDIGIRLDLYPQNSEEGPSRKD